MTMDPKAAISLTALHGFNWLRSSFTRMLGPAINSPITKPTATPSMNLFMAWRNISEIDMIVKSKTSIHDSLSCSGGEFTPTLRSGRLVPRYRVDLNIILSEYLRPEVII